MEPVVFSAIVALVLVALFINSKSKKSRVSVLTDDLTSVPPEQAAE